jgi:hypothetical protein
MNARPVARATIAAAVAAAVAFGSLSASAAAPRKQKRATNDKITTECVPGAGDYDINKCHKTIKR